MQNLSRLFLVMAVAALVLHATADVQAQQNAMTFFITSVGSGKGADLGGLAGADRHCQNWRRQSEPVTGRGTPT